MKEPEPQISIVIIGGGPVGLFMAISLLKKGIQCRVIEKREEPVSDSRSLGIHPVSLELFDKVGITDPFLEQGLKIKKGIALTEDKEIGEISFDLCPKPHNYILACPQFITEKILQKKLRELDENALITGAEFLQFHEYEKAIETTFTVNGKSKERITSSYLIGCDGKNSLVRQQASIHFSGKRYHDTYIMGDFDDTTNFATNAAVFLPKDGLIECFPLPSGMRRWVVKTDSYISEPSRDKLAEIVQQRIGYDLFSVNNIMLSSFGVQHLVAERFTKGRVILAGDAAHVVSPIGGQGMNLGWLDCWKLANIFEDSLKHTDSQEHIKICLKEYSNRQKKITKKAGRRAELNMILGRKTSIPFLRNLIVKGMLKTPLRTKAAKLFTMRGLEGT
ncbi:MAG TPA: NAD(P)/FAD-dependent oxidoreductase [Gracilimonas sp.]|uniref:FAD-dependent oxidoreductase n=1 Tax=Gracilimonas sp. TaxID=1974203 RepID=UPI002D946544|nr:NAD(P)/FAD-dependent oxidoreductase [Gracilimonas sp.]